MGYSCTARARLVMDVLQERIGDASSSNVFGNGQYFHEIGRENPDGHISGSVYCMTGHRCGSFSISAEGKIERFPRVSKQVRAAIETAALARYVERYEKTA